MKKIHAAQPLGRETACGLRFTGRVVAGDTAEVQTASGRKMTVSTKWRNRTETAVTCVNCWKVIP